MLERADRWLIEKVFEPVAHFSERGFGISNFTLARFFILMWPVADATCFWQEQRLADLFWVLFGLVFVWMRWSYLSILESMQGANPDRAHGEWRIFMLGLGLIAICITYAVPEARSYLLLIATAGTVLHVYFSACRRPPPLQERSWGWRERQV